MIKSDQPTVYHSISKVNHQTVLNTYNTDGIHRKFRISVQPIYSSVFVFHTPARFSRIPSLLLLLKKALFKQQLFPPF